MKKVFLLSAALISLSACDKLPDYLRLDTPMNPLKASDKPAVIAAQQRWWSVFNDPMMGALADQLLTQNIDLKIAQARVEEARGIATTSRASLFPEISASGNVSRGNKQIGSSSPLTISQGGFDAIWELDVFGHNRAGINASEQRLNARQADAENITNIVLADLMRAIIEWRKAHQTIKETNDLLASQDDQVKLFAARTRAGLVDATFLERAEAQRAQTATQLPIAQGAAQSAQYQIERLLGKSAGELTSTLLSYEGELSLPNAGQTLEVKIETIRQRPDIIASRFELLAAQSSLAQAEADLWPRISISSFFGVQDISGDTRSADNPIWSLASGITAPLLNFGKLRGAVDAANARATQAGLTYENNVLLALQEAKTALSDYLNGMNAYAQQDIALKHRRDTVKLAKERFDRGLTDMTDLTTAQSELDQATITLIDRKATTAIAYIRLQKALGLAFATNAQSPLLVP